MMIRIFSQETSYHVFTFNDEVLHIQQLTHISISNAVI